VRPTIEFRRLERGDFATLVEWFVEPHIARWWNETATLEAVEAKYGPTIDGREPTAVWIVEIDGAPAGLLQSYRNRDYPATDAAVAIADAAGIDYFLASDFTGRGLCPAVIAEFTLLVFRSYPDVEWCAATPARENEPSWRCLERAGFERMHECQPPHEPPAFAYAVRRLSSG
jgi:aminoglycoside 6'-N-acetyltransferase